MIKKKNSFNSKLAPISRGNLFEINTQLLVQDSINKNTIDPLKKNSSNIADKITSVVKDKFKSQLINNYYLLNYMVDYFVNTIDFDCNDIFLFEHIVKIIRVAFLYGRAGIYIDNKNFSIPKIYAVSIVKTEIDIFGNLIKAELGNIHNYINSQTEIKIDENVNNILIENEQCDNLIIFNWGTSSFSAWVNIYPFILQQEMLLEMLLTTAFSKIKKFAYNVNDVSQITKEFDLFFNSKNPFVIKSGLIDKEFGNRIEEFNNNFNSGGDEMINFYNDYINIYYSLFGRRINEDEKKERNITMEVGASQEQYSALQAEYKTQFKIFCEKFNNHILNNNKKIEFKSKLDIQIGENNESENNNEVNVNDN